MAKLEHAQLVNLKYKVIVQRRPQAGRVAYGRTVGKEKNSSLVTGAINQLVGLNPRHHSAQLLTYDFDLMLTHDATL